MRFFLSDTGKMAILKRFLSVSLRKNRISQGVEDWGSLISVPSLRLLNALNSEDRGLKVRFSLATIAFDRESAQMSQMLSSQGKNAPSDPYPHYNGSQPWQVSGSPRSCFRIGGGGRGSMAEPKGPSSLSFLVLFFIPCFFFPCEDFLVFFLSVSPFFFQGF